MNVFTGGRQTNFKGAFRHIICVNAALVNSFFLFFFQLPKGQSNLICSSQPIIALAGNDVILPCRLDPPISASSRTVEWTKPGLDPEYIHVHQDGRLVYQSQNPLYNYRTALFVDQLINGNVSMKIFKVKISDAGKYKCFLPSLWKDSFIQLTVGKSDNSEMRIDKINKSTSGVVLQCNSTGWYPEPEVFWLDGEGNLLSAGPTETVRGPDDLYTVSSRVTVEKRHSNSFTCRVQQNHINQTREAKIHVPGLHIIMSVVCVLLLLSALVFVVWKLSQNKSRTLHI
uniref:Ig-like domain-containing protein n=1 Tax=Sparus aurata TaxID=8175 RepID=A0A671UV75_SPAAU